MQEVKSRENKSTGDNEGAGRGRKAEIPREIPKPGWKEVLLRVKREQSRDNLSILAAGVAFFTLLALFPALAALVAIYGMVSDPGHVQQQLADVQDFMPQEAFQIIDGQLRSLVAQPEGALGLGALVALLLALWSAAKGMKAMITALNVVYEEEETRGFLKLNGVAILMTAGTLIFAVIALSLIVGLPAFSGTLGLPEALRNVIGLARWPVLALLIMGAMSFLYRMAPDRRRPRWRWVTWGGVAGTVLWIVASYLFSFYVARFGRFNATYGSLGAVVILLMWLQITAYVILLGAEFNAEMERQTRKGTTAGGRRPMGEREA